MREDRHNLVYLIDSLGLGGAERMLVNLLPYIDASQFNIRICTFAVRDGNPMAVQLENMGFPLDTIPVSKLRNPSALPKVLRYLRQYQVDILHTQLVFADILGSLAARILGIPNLSTQHRLDAPHFASRSHARRVLMWWAMRLFSDLVIAVSEKTRQHHIRHGRIPPQKIITLYNGVDLSEYQSVDNKLNQQIRTDLGIPSNAPVLITVAVLREPKGIQHMLTAMPSILGRYPDARYLVVGSGPYAQALTSQVRTLGLDEKVIFTGQRSDIPQLLGVGDIFVHPTLEDALPTVLAEAMAAGKSIIGSNVGGVPEMVIHERNGILVPPTNIEALIDSCIELISNSHRRHQMEIESRALAEEKFDIRKQGAELNAIYLELLEK